MILNRLNKLANHFDQLGLLKEADLLDYLMRKLAMDFGEARSLLGVGHNATPDEIQKAWKAKALEHHPDRGGDLEKMKAINVARDLLLGERPPERTRTETHDRPGHPFRTKPNEPKIRTWEEAVQKVDIPAEVNWKLKTDTAYGSIGMSGHVVAFVVYGTTQAGDHIFVGVHHYTEHNIANNIDEYKMWLDTYPNTAKLADVAPGAFRNMWAFFPGVKAYNAKVQILPAGAVFSPSLSHFSGRDIAFKDAMVIMGETPTSYSAKKKVDIIMELGYPPKEGHFGEYTITFVVNGKPYILNQENSNTLRTKSNLFKFVFGGYYYADSKKNLTRQPADKRKKILDYLAAKLEGKEPEELIAAFKLASEQATK